MGIPATMAPAMKAMKAMKTVKTTKAMKAMKVMKAKKLSVIAKGKLMRAVVFNGRKQKTASGHKKTDLMKSKTGKIITKAQHAAGKKAYGRIKGWTAACQKAKKELGVTGFVPLKKGSALYKKAKEIYAA